MNFSTLVGIQSESEDPEPFNQLTTLLISISETDSRMIGFNKLGKNMILNQA
jgi:hypothetical protein